KLPVWGNRVVAIEVLTVPPLCVCCIYMPSRNTKSSSSDKENYKHYLDQLEEILGTYSSTHAVLILGDMNASIQQRKGNAQDGLLKDFVESSCLECLQSGMVTFMRPNKLDKAEIDYILFNMHGGQLVTAVEVDTRTATNTSDHVAVIGTLDIPTKESKKELVKLTCKPRWDKCDKTAYRQSIRENLLPFDTFLPARNGSIDVLQPLSHLNAVLRQATLRSIPKYRSEITVREIRK
ncbi:MAG: hypothetical protein AB2693_03120, partial [Candidatus Thiodiazotropha sp.]